ncbi:MAG: hypothetical protein EOP06_00645 [Proteobacteria bacterium]|nr:MAG: hypothetical protein EOP06_00645 [Pseudomonadota bacterium]
MALTKENKNKLMTFCKTEWSEVSEELPSQIQTVNESESGSYFSRHTDINQLSNNGKKSLRRIISHDEVANCLHSVPDARKKVLDSLKGQKIISLHKEYPNPDFSIALRRSRRNSQGARTGLRYELFGGEYSIIVKVRELW